MLYENYFLPHKTGEEALEKIIFHVNQYIT